MQKVFLIFLILCFSIGNFASKNNEKEKSPITEKSSITPKPELITDPELPNYQDMYDEMQLNGIINYVVFEQAMIGHSKFNLQKEDIITLIDFTKPSTQERFYVIDLKQRKLLYSTHVSHGKNSGENYANSFSNQNESYKSSLGFFRTENTYQGKNGYSLVLEGLEKGINDNAKRRAIVIHGANYSNPSIISSTGRLGRSYGCPALPQSITKPVINIIKGGSLLFIYANDKNYLKQSSILNL